MLITLGVQALVTVVPWAAMVVWVERLSSAATNAVAGAGIRLGGVAAALLLTTVVWALISRHRHHAAPPESEEVPSTGSSDPSR